MHIPHCSSPAIALLLIGSVLSEYSQAQVLFHPFDIEVSAGVRVQPLFLNDNGFRFAGDVWDNSDPEYPRFGVGVWSIDLSFELYGTDPEYNLETVAYGADGISRIESIEGPDGINYSHIYPGGFGYYPGLNAEDEFITMYSMSGNGRTAFGVASGDTSSYPVFWTQGGPQTPLNCGAIGDCSFFPLAASFDGTAAAGVVYQGGSAPFQVAHWSAFDGLQIIGDSSPDNFFGQQVDISSDGLTVVAKNPSGEPFRWTAAGGIQTLGHPPGSTLTQSGAYQIKTNANGSLVQVFTRFHALQNHVWTPPQGWRPIEVMLEDLGAHGLQGANVNIAFAREFNPLEKAMIVGLDDGDGQDPITAVAYFGDSFPGTVGLNSCGPARFNSSGFPAILLAAGSAAVADNTLQLTAKFLPIGVCGFLLNSSGQDFVPTPGNSSGNLCLGGGHPIGRHNTMAEVRISDATGEFQVALDLLAIPSPTFPMSIQAGETRYFQAWFRDTDDAGQATSNFTDAVAVTFE